jgi:hypothetical protein
MNTRSARTYTMMEFARLCTIQQPPSNKGELDLSHGEGSDSLLHGGGLSSDLMFASLRVAVVGLSFK